VTRANGVFYDNTFENIFPEENPMKKALITGITGQDGSYLAEFLLSKGYEVHGIVRRVALESPEDRMWRLKNCLDRIHIHAASMESYPSLFKVVEEVNPDECYHLAAMSFVSYSFEDEFSTIDTNINGTHYILSALKHRSPACRFYFAGSSEMFGKVRHTPQNETTPFHPRSPYGISKVAGFHLTRNYREAHELMAWNGILFNHESPRRGFEFVTRKITSHAAKIKLGLEDKISLGNLDAKRDWGHAKDYVEAMWLMLQQDEPQDYVIATGRCYSVRQFLEAAFSYVDLDYHDHLEINNRLFRPSDVMLLQGDATKAQINLGWNWKTSFEELVKEMVESDLAFFKKRLV
jgi:GDPmannose 4,6-dehydratase